MQINRNSLSLQSVTIELNESLQYKPPALLTTGVLKIFRFKSGLCPYYGCFASRTFIINFKGL